MADIDDKPLVHLAEAERSLDVASPPLSGRERLSAFEAKVLGEDHPRPYGQIERGVGSHFSHLESRHRAHHAALEELIAAEEEHRKASAAEDAAHARLESAIHRAAATEEKL